MKHLMLFFKPVQNSLAAFFLFMGIWFLLSLFFDPYIVPPPAAVIKNLDSLCNGVFMENLGISLGRILTGFGVSLVLGTAIGIVSFTLHITATVETLLVLFQVIPGLILGIVFLLMFGVGSAAPVCLIVTLSTPFIAINTANTLMKRNPVLEGVIRSFNGGFFHLLTDLYLPSLVPALKTNATQGLVMALKIVLLGEFIASDNGIGYLLNAAKIYFNMEAVFFYLLVVLLLMLCFQVVLNSLFVIFFQKYLYPD